MYLWEFLLALLADDDTKECIHWIAKEQRIFEIKDVDEVAKLWGMMKEKPAMNKETFLRSLRCYYTSVLRKVYTVCYNYIISWVISLYSVLYTLPSK